MTLLEQIFWGGCFLAICLSVQTICLALSAQVISAVKGRTAGRRMSMQVTAVLWVSLAFIVLALTIQVWIWAFVYISYQILPDWNSAVYFSLVTFSALGYGDIVMGPEVRIFATFGSVTGLLSFGINTAFLVAVMRVFGQAGDDQSKGEKSRAIGAP